MRFIHVNSSILVPTSLYIDSIVDFGHYPQIHSIDMYSSIVCILEDTSCEPGRLSILIELHDHMLVNNQILTATSMIDLDFIFIIAPFNDSKSFGLYKFSTADIIGDSPELLINYISDIKTAQKLLQEMFKNYYLQLQYANAESETAYSKCESIANYSKECNNELVEVKSQVVSLYEQFVLQENEFKNSECINCRSNSKDILFLPCGHVSICSECLKYDYKITVDLPIIDSHMVCSICNLKVSQALKCGAKRENISKLQ